MTETDTSSSPRPKALLEGLLAAWEDEALECKQAEKSFDTDKLGKYFSPLSNEAALRGIQNAWMLLGIDVRSHRIVGTSAFPLPRTAQQPEADDRRAQQYKGRVP